MNDRILLHYIDGFRSGFDLEPEEAETLFDAIISSQDVGLIADLLRVWNEKGAVEEELFQFASIMRGRMKRIESRQGTLVDIVGTGGSPVKTFNVSTAAAFVIAGTGLAVAKHGNRAATSKCGSADVLASLGIDVDVEPKVSEQQLNEHGLCFMFAPRFHSLSPALAAARRSIGAPTIFNNLGPLCNPASAPHLVIGVWHKHLLEITAKVLLRLGSKRSWTVYGENGLDEIALKGTTLVAELDGDKIDVFEITPADFGVYTLGKDLPARCSAEESSEIIRAVLNNGMKGRDAERLVLINAAAAIHVAGGAPTLLEAHSAAEESIRSGSAARKLNDIRGASTK